MFWKKLKKAQSANKLFSQANQAWRQRKCCLLNGDDDGAKQACIEVIRLCQLSLDEDERIGDAYVLLANALLAEASHLSRQSNPYQYSLLQPRGASVIHWWHSLPHRGYPITKNKAIGDQLWSSAVEQLMRDKATPEDGVLSLMNSWKDSLAVNTISPISFQHIKELIDGHYEMGEYMIGKAVELFTIAATCKVNAKEMLNGLVDSMKVASELVNAQHSQGWKYSRWAIWLETFLEEWSCKCFLVWQDKHGVLTDYQLMYNLWLSGFEPLWLVGCDIARADRRENIKWGMSEYLSNKSEPVSKTDEEAFWKFTNSYDEAALKAIDLFKGKQRQAIKRTLKEMRDYDSDTPEGKLKRFMSTLE